ncbi:MAG: 30S ribosomal protein S20 [Thermogutta sp.]|nr:30S ribosomal protein S20 [Thermogutta sp.]HPZ81877.1 30S ribosomal protein S20 [Thermogutta sp.]HQF15128.1 30S ribosomal protein S20 [Thermogutta sp.]
MPNTKSAKKRLRQNIKRRAHNRSIKRSVRTQCRKVREAVAAGDLAKAEEEFRKAYRLLDRAGAKRIIHPNAAARTKSRLASAMRKARQSAVGAPSGA